MRNSYYFVWLSQYLKQYSKLVWIDSLRVTVFFIVFFLIIYLRGSSRSCFRKKRRLNACFIKSTLKLISSNVMSVYSYNMRHSAPSSVISPPRPFFSQRNVMKGNNFLNVIWPFLKYAFNGLTELSQWHSRNTSFRQ